MSVTDLAVCILKNRGKAVHFKELISEVMRVKAISLENPGRLIAQMHTEINLDSRFIHQGNGEWALREWLNKGNKVVKIRPEAPAPAARKRSRLRDDEEDEEGYESEDEDGLASDEEDEDANSDEDNEHDDYYEDED